MSDAAEARRKRMEKIKARANNQEVLTQSLLSGDISQYKSQPEPVKTELQNLGQSEITPLANTKIPSDPQSLISPQPQVTEPITEKEPEMDAFEKYRKIKKLEQQRRQYLRTKSVALVLLALTSAIYLSYTGDKDHHNFFFTFIIYYWILQFYEIFK